MVGPGRTTILLAAVVAALVARAEDRVRVRPGTAVAREAQPKPPRAPRAPELRGTIIGTTAATITIETPANPLRKEWVVPTEDVLEVFLDGEPEELRSGRWMVVAGDGAGALEQLAAADRAAAWDDASDAVRAERAFVAAAAAAQVAIRSGTGLVPALDALRGLLAAQPRSHHTGFVQELLGDVLLAHNRPDEAIAAYAAIATRQPARRIRAERLVARLHLGSQRWPEAKASLERAIAIEPPADDASARLEHREARLLLVRCLARSGRAEDAIALAHRLIAEAVPEDGAGLALMYVALAEAQQAAGGRNREALISCLAVDAVHNGVPEAHAEALARLVDLWEQENHPERAREARQNLEQTYPTSPWLERVREPAGL
jgi:tetratricopeptide (TPR) repeat protein